MLSSAPEELRQPLLRAQDQDAGRALRGAAARARSTSTDRGHQDQPCGPWLAAGSNSRPSSTHLDTQLRTLVAAAAPTLVALPGVGVDTAGQLLVTAGDNPERLRCEAAFAHLCGVAPIPASSGRTDRHRLNRGGDRQANNAL